MYNTLPYKIARGLGWFSIALGAIEVFAPRAVTSSLGMGENDGLTRGFGLREIGAGLGILTQKDPTPWMWARVAGDALDLMALLFAQTPNNPRRGTAGAAFLSVAGITLLDFLCAESLQNHVAYRRQPRRDYSDRSGFPLSAEEMRGAAKVRSLAAVRTQKLAGT
jgi:hypothetical protein